MSRLKDKMYNYEVTVPGNSWDKIASALDESELQNKFPQRLYNLEQVPPAGVWDRIIDSLENNDVPVTAVRKFPPFLRYAAAAILVSIVAFGIIKFAINNDNSEPYSATTGTNTKDTNTTTIKPKDTGEALDEQTLREEQNKNQNLPEKMIAKSRPTTKKLPRRVVNTVFTQSPQVESELSQSIYAYADHVPDIADRYVMLMTPDGNIIRMSKKWGNLLCCVSGEEQDPGCKSQIKKWQEKIASSSLAPSPGNFMDILGLVNSLNENNEL